MIQRHSRCPKKVRPKKVDYNRNAESEQAPQSNKNIIVNKHASLCHSVQALKKHSLAMTTYSGLNELKTIECQHLTFGTIIPLSLGLDRGHPAANQEMASHRGLQASIHPLKIPLSTTSADGFNWKEPSGTPSQESLETGWTGRHLLQLQCIKNKSTYREEREGGREGRWREEEEREGKKQRAGKPQRKNKITIKNMKNMGQ